MISLQTQYARLVSTTNSRFENYCGCVGNLRLLDNGCFLFDTLNKWVRSSVVQNIEDGETQITIHTMNSVYVFEKVSDTVFRLEECIVKE